MMETLKRWASGQPFAPRKKGERQYGSVIERTLAWMIDITVIYTLGGGIIRWLTQKLYGVDYEAGLYAAKRAVANDLYARLRATAETMDPSILFNAESFRLFLMENLLGYAVVGLVILSLQIGWGQTPGKWLLGLKVVRRGSLAPLSPVRYGLRYLAYLLAVAPLMLGILWADFNREKRGWHDMLVDTVVIHTRPDGWYWAQTKRGIGWLKERMFG